MQRNGSSIPAGAHMPAEWEVHERTLVGWPVKRSLVWPDNYEEVCDGYAEVVKAIACFEPVTVIVSRETAQEARKRCGTGIDYLEIDHDDAWIRDSGPTYLVDDTGEIAGINWIFNAWGEKYKPYDKDNEVAGKVLEYFGVPRIDVPIVLEGGSIHSDGEGTLLTTRQCLLNPNRNPQLDQGRIEETVKGILGIKEVIWLNNGLAGDETDGHVDNVACFARPGIVLLQASHDPEDPNYETTQENLQILRESTDAAGRRLTVIEIPQPQVRTYQGVPLTLSYLNFYIVNNGIILPIFGGDAEDTDRRAEQILSEAFPDRRIVTVDGMKLIKEGGNVHCITQQVPARRSK